MSRGGVRAGEALPFETHVGLGLARSSKGRTELQLQGVITYIMRTLVWLALVLQTVLSVVLVSNLAIANFG